MSLQTHILASSSKELSTYSKEIQVITDSVVSAIEKVTPIGDIDIVFYNNPETVIKELGIGGFTPLENTIFMSLDVNNPNFKESLKGELEYTITHEINHAIRFRTPIPKETLLEAAISEGLADHFAVQITGKKPAAWTHALTDVEEKGMIERMKKEWNEAPYNHNAWFYGSKEMNIPRWTAYTIGFNLVGKYLEANPDTKASDIISAETKLFV
jgi:uncharacterized protein YjaZ